jgi:two-component system sensor histidine kinase CpxA
LENAVERLGRGDFTARINSSRRDELGRLSDAFDRMAGRIQSLVGAERRLLADISHELRSPLTRLGVAIELARSGQNLEASLDRIEREADRLNALVGSLLEVTRGEVDPSALRREELLLDELTRDTAETCRLEADDRPCTLQLDAPQPVPLRGDPELLRRALENVIRNAIRYSPPAETVDIEVTAAAGGARVLVRDRGPGVPEAALPHLFEAFYRVEADRNPQTGGFGLGLSIARRAVEVQGGRISARNAQPGLAVEIFLPAAA